MGHDEFEFHHLLDVCPNWKYTDNMTGLPCTALPPVATSRVKGDQVHVRRVYTYLAFG